MSIAAPYILSYLFLISQPLSWSQTLYGIFSGYMNIMKAIGLIVILPLIKMYRHTPDTLCLAWGYASAIVSQVLFAVSVKTWMVFLCKYNVSCIDYGCHATKTAFQISLNHFKHFEGFTDIYLSS